MNLKCQWKYPVNNLSWEVGTQVNIQTKSQLLGVIVDALRRISYPSKCEEGSGQTECWTWKMLPIQGCEKEEKLLDKTKT